MPQTQENSNILFVSFRISTIIDMSYYVNFTYFIKDDTTK